MADTPPAAKLRLRATLVDAQTLAEMLGVGRAYVYEHADELGAIRLGSGTRARLRFDPERATHCLAGRKSQQDTSPAKPAVRRTRRRRSMGTTVELLPIRGHILGETVNREAA
jgi:hypothetical protein